MKITEYIVGNSIVACLEIHARPTPERETSTQPWFQGLSQILRGICSPKDDAVKLFDGRAYHPVYANNLNPKYSCSWTATGDGGGYGQTVLYWASQPKMRILVKVKLIVAKNGSRAWLTVEYNPTTLKIGHNVHPAAFIDPHTGELDSYPSSSWSAMTRDFRLGFEFLEAMTDSGSLLLDPDTKLAIERGDFHLVRVQYAATKAVPNVTNFLQVGAVIYGQTIARGRGIVNNAKHLGLRFKPYAHSDPDEDRLSGFMLQKLHGNKLHVSVSFYDKLVRLQQMHQEGILTLAEAQTVDRSVRQDVTLHSTLIQYVAEAAQKKLAKMSEADWKFFDFISPEEFLQGTPKATAWWFQRGIFVLSHRRVQDRWVRYSFATWLLPFVETELMHFDVVAGITTEGYHSLLSLNDKVAAAWRSDKTPGAGDWAGRLASIAGCVKATVYGRRDKWRKKYGIDIARPLQMYSDILYYGHNSIARPENITALMVAVDQEAGDEAVRLHAEAIADFEQKRVKNVNPALGNPPRAMELTLPRIDRQEGDEMNDLPTAFGDLPPDFDDDGLDEVVPRGRASARPTANKPGTKIILGRARNRPPPPTEKKVALPVRLGPPPQSGQKALVLRGGLSPPPPKKKVALRVTPSPPSPPMPTGRIVLRARRTPPPPPAMLTGRIVLRARRTPPPPPPMPTGRIVLRGRRPGPPPPTTGRATQDG